MSDFVYIVTGDDIDAAVFTSESLALESIKKFFPNGEWARDEDGDLYLKGDYDLHIQKFTLNPQHLVLDDFISISLPIHPIRPHAEVRLFDGKKFRVVEENMPEKNVKKFISNILLDGFIQEDSRVDSLKFFTRKNIGALKDLK